MSLRDEIAAELNGASYPLRLTKDLRDRAKAAGILIVYGASDDLMEFDGVFQEEVEAYEGGEAHIDATGVLDRSQVDDDDGIADYVMRLKSARKIEAVWGEDGYSFTFRTDIPHATFDVLYDGETYCRAMVIDLADLAGGAAPTTPKSRAGEICYSTDEETFSHDSVDEVIQSLIDNGVEPLGAVVYRGTARKPDAAQFFDADTLIDQARDRACDEFGEWADDFADVDKAAKVELDTLLEQWARKHCEVTFYSVTDIQPYTITQDDVSAFEQESAQ